LRDRWIVRVDEFTDRKAALDAAGLRVRRRHLSFLRPLGRGNTHRTRQAVRRGTVWRHSLRRVNSISDERTRPTKGTRTDAVCNGDERTRPPR
jgi:hypothetical protein